MFLWIKWSFNRDWSIDDVYLKGSLALSTSTNISRHIGEVIRRSKYRESAINPWTPESRIDQEKNKKTPFPCEPSKRKLRQSIK